jgi:Family of unknown function (DUF6152)
MAWNLGDFLSSSVNCFTFVLENTSHPWDAGPHPGIRGHSLKGRDIMGLRSTAALAGLSLATASCAAMAHHSFAMFDTAHPIEISGTVKEFRYVNPHSVLIVEVRGTDGSVREWTLESPAPGIMGRQGVTANSFKPGDSFSGKISPLHSGEPGGSYFPPRVDLANPVAAPK